MALAGAVLMAVYTADQAPACKHCAPQGFIHSMNFQPHRGNFMNLINSIKTVRLNYSNLILFVKQC